MAPERDWQAIFDASYRKFAVTVRRRVWREVYGEEYPEEIDPYSFVSRSELSLLREELRVGPGDLFGDLGCGRGGPGLWLAAQTGADLVGVDISEVALSAAAARAAELGLGSRAHYRLGSFADTGLATAALDAVVSIDALIFAPDKRAALGELARILRPGGRLALTTWDYHTRPPGRPPQLADHRSVLAAVGFTVSSYTETHDWRHRITAISDRLLDAVEEIAAETGEQESAVRAGHEQMRRTVDHIIRRVLIVAERNP